MVRPDRLLPLLLLSGLLALAAVPGCYRDNIPPHPSLAKFVREPPPRAGCDGRPGARPASEIGRVTLGTGAGLQVFRNEQDGPLGGYLALFLMEGALTLRLARRYDLAVSVGSHMMLEVDGNLWLLAGPRFRMGLLHGAALGVRGCAGDCAGGSSGDDWDGRLHYNVSAGLMAQNLVGTRSVIFYGARYAFASWRGFGYYRDQFSRDYWSHYLTASVGWLLRAGRLRIAPEIVFMYGRHTYTDLNTDPPEDRAGDEYIIIPSVSFSTGF